MEKWHVHNGIVVTNNMATENPNNIEGLLTIYVADFLPFISGELSNFKNKISKIRLLDYTNNKIERTISTSNTISATYLGAQSNISIPDVVPGEQVAVIQYKGQGPYFWFFAGRDDRLRKEEHFKIECANKGNQLPVMGDLNGYSFEINTFAGPNGKFISLKTTMNDTEKFTYEIRLDPNTSTISANDNDGNSIVLNSLLRKIILTNKDLSIIDIDKKNITLTAPETLTINANNINVNSIKNTNLTNTNLTNTSAETVTSKSKTINIISKVGDIIVKAISLVLHVHSIPTGTTGPPKDE